MTLLPAPCSSTRRTTRALLLGSALLSFLLHSGAASAQEPAAHADAEVMTRLAFVESALEREEPRMRFWFDSWIGAFAGLALGQAGVALGVTDRKVQISATVGAIKATIGVVGLSARPATARTAASTLRAMTATTPEEHRRKLHLAESLLQKSAEQERGRRSWLALTGSAVINLAGAAVLWIGYRDYKSGWLGLGAGVAVAQVQLWTQPRGAAVAWDAYARGRFYGPLPRPAPGLSFSLLPAPSGVSLAGSF
ncbi:MAG: hypothetical protein ABJE95_28630 [Byssovorax sp.]